MKQPKSSPKVGFGQIFPKRSKVGPKVGFLVEGEGKSKTYFWTSFSPISGISPRPTLELLFGYFIFFGDFWP